MLRSGTASPTSCRCSSGDPRAAREAAAAGVSDSDPTGRLTLTRGDRLARLLREDHSVARRNAGGRVWESPAIKSLDAWLRDAWTGSWPSAQLLNPTQELALWQRAIETDPDSAQLLSPVAAAREARLADQMLRRLRLDLADAPKWRDEHRAFARWRQTVEAEYRSQDWLTAADLPAAVVLGLQRGEIDAPPQICLRGFDDASLTPAEQALFAALVEAGSVIERVDAPVVTAAQIERRQDADAEAQFRAIACDIREQLRPYADDRQAPPRILLALADVDARRELIESVFRAVLAPAAALPGAVFHPPWRWERGRPLREQPLADAALAVIGLDPGGNAWPLLSRLLLSTVLWNPQERLEAAEAECRLRERGYPRPRLARIREALSPRLRERFAALAQVMSDEPARALPSEWARRFQARLDAIGWPGSAPLDSQAFQAMREWLGAGTRLATLDPQLGRIDLGSARAWLAQIVSDARFQMRAEHLQPITIASIDEVAGLPCDRLYVADASIDRFPASRRASPFVANEFQLAHGWPGASPERVLAEARQTVARLLAGAPQVSVSCAEFDERGAQVQPSPLFGDGWKARHISRQICEVEIEAAAAPQTQWPEQDPVPPVSPRELPGLGATSALFQLWFESPFFAFCRVRLGIQPLPRVSAGLNAGGQGSLSHAVLEALWSELSERRRLLATDSQALAERVHAEVLRQMPRYMQEADFGRVQCRLELERQADLLTQWMEHERDRVDDFAVAHVEREFRANVAGLPLRLRVDRIDRVQTPEGERWLVIDYKTGADADPRGWKAERLTEPQLPLYASHALTGEAGVPRVDGICFAHVKDGHPALVAATNWRERLRDDKPGRFRTDWSGDLARWRALLEQAAQGFLAGEAWIDDSVGERSFNSGLLLLAGHSAGESGEPEAP